MSDNINAIIIDDEENFSNSLEVMIRKNFPKINIIAYVNNVKDAVKLIKKTTPSLLFLDINLPDGTGFDIIDQTNSNTYDVIFTTSYSEYAVRAFEFAALHFLLKPISLLSLKEAIDRYSKAHDKDYLDVKLRVLKESMVEKPEKILLPSSDGINIYNIFDIVRCEADDNYAKVFFNNGKVQLISKPLLSLKKILNELGFVRIHSKHLINLRYLKKFLNTKKPSIILSNGTELPLTITYKLDFVEKLNKFAKSL